VNVMYVFPGFIFVLYSATCPRQPPSSHICTLCFPNPSTPVDSGLIVIVNHPLFTPRFHSATSLPYVAYKYVNGFLYIACTYAQRKTCKDNKRDYSYRKEKKLKLDKISDIFDHFRSLFPNGFDPLGGNDKPIGPGIAQ